MPLQAEFPEGSQQQLAKELRRRGLLEPLGECRSGDREFCAELLERGFEIADQEQA